MRFFTLENAIKRLANIRLNPKLVPIKFVISKTQPKGRFMKNLRVSIFALLITTVAATATRAHVALDYPVGGEVFNQGDIIDVQWHIVIPHNLLNWDLYFSDDGGIIWQAIELNLPSEQLNYLWIVPGVATTQGRIKIIMDNSGSDYEDQSGDFIIVVPTDIHEEWNQGLPKGYKLNDNYPNPFNAATVIEFGLPETGRVTIEIYDLLGRKVQTLVNEIKQRGTHKTTFDANELKSGVYFYRFQAGDVIETKRMLLLK